MMDSAYLRKTYNERFSGDASRWTSGNLKTCLGIAQRVTSWCGFTRKKGKKMLDVGCALGIYTESFRLHGFDASGLDYSDVAIEKAKQIYPLCTFFHADGFNPNPGWRYDLIFCRGFSGANSHDLEFVAQWANKYMNCLNEGGRFVFSYSSDFSGKERNNETINWTHDEMIRFSNMIDSARFRVKYYYRYYLLSRLAYDILDLFRKVKLKRYFYIIFEKE